MDSSFTPIEQMLKFRASRHEDFPYQEILLTRLCMHMQSKLLENRNKMLNPVPTRRVLPMNWKNAVGLNVVKAITIAAACICN